MSENAAIIARIIEHNTDRHNRASIDRAHIGVIARQHSRFDGDLDDAIATAYSGQSAGYERVESGEK